MGIDPADKGLIKTSPLSARSKNALLNAGFESLLGCGYLTIEYLVSFKNIGRKSAHEILNYIEDFKLDEGVYPLSEDCSIGRLPLSIGAKQILVNAGYTTLNDLLGSSLSNLSVTQSSAWRNPEAQIRIFLDYCKKRSGKEPLAEATDNTQVSAEEQTSPRNQEYLIKLLSLSIYDIGLSCRTINILKPRGVHTVLDLIQEDLLSLRKVRYCGNRTIADIKRVIETLELRSGLRLNKELLLGIISYAKAHEETGIAENIKYEFPDKFSLVRKARIQSLPPEKIKHIMDVYRLYQDEGTLERVGRRLNLTRERIRQILVKGTKLGLFSYSGREYPFIEKEEILNSCAKCRSLNQVALSLHIPLVGLRQLLTAYNIVEDDIVALRRDFQKRECVQSYKLVELELCRHPTVADLQNNKDWRYLYKKIARLWGSFDCFRDELNIPKPIRRLPKATSKWQEDRRRLALIVRMQYLDQIRDSLINRGPRSCTEIASECGIKSSKVLRLLGLLIATGEVVRKGEGFNTKYVLETVRS